MTLPTDNSEDEVFQLRKKNEILKRRVSELEKITSKDSTNDYLSRVIEPLSVLEIAFNQSPNMIYISNTDGHVIYVNHELVRRTGYSESELLGNFSNKFRIEGDDDDRMWDLWNTISEGNVWKGEFLNKTKSGETYWVEAIISPIFDKESNITSYMTFQSDISDRKEKEKLRKQYEELKTLSTLIGIIVHDFKNALSVIRFSADLLRYELTEKDQQLKYFKEINEAVSLATSISNRLISIGRSVSKQLGPVNVAGLVDRNRIILSRIVKFEIEMVVEINTPYLWIFGDEIMINQMILNLVSNANEAIIGSGIIKISVEQVVIEEQQYTCHLDGREVTWINNSLIDIKQELKDGEFVAIHVIDTGPGIAPENIEKIFDTFYTTKSEGSGLGLSSVNGIIFELDGYLGVTSDNTGTAFHILLPRIEYN